MNTVHTIRGGSWLSLARIYRSAYRDGFGPDFRDDVLGFRLINRRGPRVVRGGGWCSDARNCRSAYRYWYDPDDRDHFLGFRLAERRSR